MRRTFWLVVSLWWPVFILDGILAAAYYEKVMTPPPPEIHFRSVCFGKIPAQDPDCGPSPLPSVDLRSTPIPDPQPSASYR